MRGKAVLLPNRDDQQTCDCIAYLDQLRGLFLLTELLEHIISLGLEVGLLFDFCLVEAVDDGVFAMGDEYALDLLIPAYTALVSAQQFHENVG